MKKEEDKQDKTSNFKNEKLHSCTFLIYVVLCVDFLFGKTPEFVFVIGRYFPFSLPSILGDLALWNILPDILEKTFWKKGHSCTKTSLKSSYNWNYSPHVYCMMIVPQADNFQMKTGSWELFKRAHTCTAWHINDMDLLLLWPTVW